MKNMMDVLILLLCARCTGVNISANKTQTPTCSMLTDFKCPREEVTFWLYTRSTQFNPTQLTLESLKSMPLKKAPLKILFHGYLGNKDTDIGSILRTAYFSKGEYHIISMDWSPMSQTYCFQHVIKCIPIVGHYTADFLNELLATKNFNDVHLLGYSMGAHISAWASNELKDLPRLTLFDPTLPGFDNESPFLKKGQARLVDIYHTNCFVMGRCDPNGDVDVYFNDGTFQPGCDCDPICSHLRSVRFYAESISYSRMEAFHCASWRDYTLGNCPMPRIVDLTTVGENLDKTVTGKFMVFTNASPPFLLDPYVYVTERSFYSFKNTVESNCSLRDDIDYTKWFLRDPDINYWHRNI